MKYIESEAVYVHDSYEKCNCGANCVWVHNSTAEKPCWGEVNAVDEHLMYDEEGDITDSVWIHACAGHDHNGKYTPPE